MRADFRLPRVEQFDQITSDLDLAAALEDLYGSVDAIDPWTGGLAEDHLPGSSMGELFTTVLVDQFTRLRDGDRYWYLRDPDLSAADINEIQATTLADIVRRNTGISQIQDNVFFMPEPGSAFLLIVLAGCSASGRRCRAGSGSRRS